MKFRQNVEEAVYTVILVAIGHQLSRLTLAAVKKLRNKPTE